MEVRYYFDPDTNEPHIYTHNVTEDEVEQVLRGRGEDLPGNRGSRMRLGQTLYGRYLKVIYVPDEDDRRSLFVITAYDLMGNSLKAFRRRQRKKSK